MLRFDLSLACSWRMASLWSTRRLVVDSSAIASWATMGLWCGGWGGMISLISLFSPFLEVSCLLFGSNYNDASLNTGQHVSIMAHDSARHKPTPPSNCVLGKVAI